MLICFLTHWGRVTHICVVKLTIIGSDNGLSPGRRQAIIWTNAGILLIGPLGTNFSENIIEILTLSFTKMRLKVSSAKWHPFSLGLNVLMEPYGLWIWKHVCILVTTMPVDGLAPIIISELSRYFCFPVHLRSCVFDQKCSLENLGYVGLWGFLWWAPSAKRKDHHGVSSGWSSVWHLSNTGLSSTQHEQIPIILGVWPVELTPFFFRSKTFWRAYG